MRKSSKLIGALAIAGIAAAGGTAFTAGNSQAASQVVGYGSTTISGATVASMTYNLSPAGDNVNSVQLVLAGDTTGSAVSIGFNGGAATSCGTGAFTTVTTYTCDNGGASFVRPTAGLTGTAVVVN
ncbi:MAG: hypothetical protein QOD70_3243 [Frankiales bacterium]|jgi:hypothetical protein|nr:hypothetical protein [Frankiales bacterium]